jgi:hypothetical protein
LEALQKDLVTERDLRRGERFFWIIALIFTFDMFMFREMSTWSGPVAVVILQVIFVVCLGRFLGDDKLWSLTEMAINKWNGGFWKGGA